MVVQQGQNLLDVALWKCGDATAAYDIAALNGLSGLTDLLSPGTVLNLPDAVDQSLVNYFEDNNIIPATGSNQVGQDDVPDGIDFWGIEIDFVIS